MIKITTKSSEGWVTTYAFWFLNKKWLVSKSESKWHKGKKYRRMPVWISTIEEDIPALFIWNIAIGYDNRKNS